MFLSSECLNVGIAQSLSAGCWFQKVLIIWVWKSCLLCLEGEKGLHLDKFFTSLIFPARVLLIRICQKQTKLCGQHFFNLIGTQPALQPADIFWKKKSSHSWPRIYKLMWAWPLSLSLPSVKAWRCCCVVVISVDREQRCCCLSPCLCICLGLFFMSLSLSL